MKIMNKLSSKFNKIGLQFKKHSPEIFLVVGVAGVVVSTVMACKATTKISGILEESRSTIDSLKATSEKPEMAETAKKDITITYVQTGLEIASVYAPAVILASLSIASIVNSHNILRKRNVALAAAYATVDKGFKEYRNRVVARFGEEVDKEIRLNSQKVKVEEVIVDENGKEKKVKVTKDAVQINEAIDFARYFDSNCSGYEKNKDYNDMFLSMQQRYANDKLKANGMLFLNDVYQLLGIKWYENGQLMDKSKAGQIVGWVYKENNDSGDNYVDFGIREVLRATDKEGTPYEKVILLDFNCDGNVWDLM